VSDIGEELCGHREPVAVRARLFEHADLGKPLCQEVVVVDDASASKGARYPRRPGDSNVDRFARAHWPVEGHFGYRSILRIPIVWCDEADASGCVNGGASANHAQA